VSKKDVEAAVSKWLTGALDRDGKRVERAKKEALKRSASVANLPDGDEDN